MSLIDFKIKCLDSSAWLAYYFTAQPEITKLIDNGGLIVTSSISLFEIKRRLLRLKKDPKELLELIKQRGTIIVPGIIIAEKAAEISINNKLAAVDAIIYATSSFSEAELITSDNDFRGLDKVKIIT